MPETKELDKWLSIYNRFVRIELANRLKPLHIKENNFYYVLLICQQPGVNQDTLIQQMHRDHSIVAKAISGLVATGWVNKAPSPTDKRALALSPTKKAKEAYAQIQDIQNVVNTLAVANLTPSEAQTFQRLLVKAAQPLKS